MPTTTKRRTAGGPSAQAGLKNPRAKIVVPGNRGIKVVQTVIILRPAMELYRFWRTATNLMQVIRPPTLITAVTEDESHWTVTAPAGRQMEWDALILNDKPGQLIAWRSRDGSDVAHAGSVRFEPVPSGEGTEVTVALEYNPPGGKIGAAIAKLTRDSVGAQVYDALRRFKALMECGEIPTTKDQPLGSPQRDRKGGR